MILKIVITVFALVSIRYFFYRYKYNRLRYLFDIYTRNIAENADEIAKIKHEVIDLFNSTGVKDNYVIHQEFLGYGNFANMRVSCFDNLTNAREDIVLYNIQAFNVALGAFSKRKKESYNPFFWLEYLLKLPQHLLTNIGLLPQSILVKVFNLLYWLMLIALGLQKANVIPNFIHP